MSLKAGRVGVAPDQVDDFGMIKSEATGGYTKQETDAKFETKTAASEALALKQPITLSVPIETLSGTKLTVEAALNAINDDVSKVEVSDTVTTEFTLESGFDKVRRVGRFKIADLTFRNVTITAWDQVGVIPEGFRPVLGVKGVSQGRQPFYIDTTGVITCGSDITNGVFAIHVVYL